MWELDHKESWAMKKWCFFNCGVEEDSWDSQDSKEIKPVHPKGNQAWIFIGRTDAKAETPILWPLDGKNWLIGKDSDAGKDWRQKRQQMMRWLDGITDSMDEFEQAPGIGDGQGSLVYYSAWGRKELDTNEQLNWTETKLLYLNR